MRTTLLALLMASVGCGKATDLDSAPPNKPTSTQVSLCGHLFTITSDVFYSDDYVAPYSAPAAIAAPTQDPQSPYYTPPSMSGFGTIETGSTTYQEPIQLPNGSWQYPQGVYGDSTCHLVTIE